MDYSLAAGGTRDSLTEEAPRNQWAMRLPLALVSNAAPLGAGTDAGFLPKFAEQPGNRLAQDEKLAFWAGDGSAQRRMIEL
jgi:hypothetical protein